MRDHTTIQISIKTLNQLKSRKQQLKLNSYDDLLAILLGLPQGPELLELIDQRIALAGDAF